MMMKRRFLAAIAALTLCTVLLTGCAGSANRGSALPDADDRFYVYDEANVLDTETENYIVTQNDALFALTGAQVVVACVNTTGSTDMGDYAYTLFNKWGIGSIEKNNGVLVLLSIGEEDYWTLQGEGLEDTLPSGILKTMQNQYLEPDFARKQYGAGVRLYFDALIAHLETAYSVDLDTWNGAAGNYTSAASSNAGTSSSGSSMSILIGAIAIVIVVLIIVMIINGAGGGSSHGGGTHRRTSPPTMTIPRTVYRGGYYPNPRPTVRPPSRPFGGMGGGFSGGGSSRSGGGGSSRGGGAGRR